MCQVLSNYNQSDHIACHTMTNSLEELSNVVLDYFYCVMCNYYENNSCYFQAFLLNSYRVTSKFLLFDLEETSMSSFRRLNHIALLILISNSTAFERNKNLIMNNPKIQWYPAKGCLFLLLFVCMSTKMILTQHT